MKSSESLFGGSSFIFCSSKGKFRNVQKVCLPVKEQGLSNENSVDQVAYFEDPSDGSLFQRSEKSNGVIHFVDPN